MKKTITFYLFSIKFVEDATFNKVIQVSIKMVKLSIWKNSIYR